jgi:hypothetical protein
MFNEIRQSPWQYCGKHLMSSNSRIFLLLPLAASIAAADPANHGEPPVKAPFLKGEDSLCVNDWWKRPTGEIIDLKVPRDQVV